MAEPLDDNSAPADMLCAISMTVMDDPVVTPSGYTFDRDVIERWVKEHGNDPMTRAPLNVGQLIPNRALKERIDTWRKETQKAKSDLSAKEKHIQEVLQKKHAEAKEAEKKLLASVIDHKGVTLAASIYHLRNNDNLLLQIVPTTPSGKAVPLHVVFMVDGSGSMELEMPMPAGIVEGVGSSRNNLTLHALKSAVSMLRPFDTFSVYIYSERVTPIIVMLKGNGENKAAALVQLEAYYKNMPGGGTATFSGLKAAYDEFDAQKDVLINNAVILLTDGQASDYPRNDDMLRMLKPLQEKCPSVTLHCVGFGNDCTHSQLSAISSSQGGGMWFIPDVTMVGATTVSLMTHLMTSLCVKSALEVEPENSRIDLGSLRNGSSRFLRVDPEELGVQDIMQQREVDVHMRLGEVSVRVKAPIVHLDADADEEVKGVDVAEQRSLFERAEVVDRLSSLLRELNRLTRVTYERDHISLMKKLTDLAEEAAQLGLDDIAEDIVSDEGHLGQVCKCLSKQEWYFSWGQRWLQTFEFAHKAQTKTGRMESSPRFYVKNNNIWQDVEDQGNVLFESIQPVKPTYAHLYDAGGNRLPVEYQGGRFSAVGRPMRIGVDNNSPPGSYASINRCGVCFAGDSAIVTPHGLKAVRSLVKGDMVSVVSREGKISASQVTCVIETELTKPTSICRLPAAAPTSTARGPSTSQRELIITERHPVAKVDSIGTIPPLNAVRWRLPNTLVAPSVSRPEYSAAGDSKVKEVFNLVLDEGHVVILEGSYLVPTLGHELEGDIVKHPFFGTSKVTECYKSNFPVEFESGKIVMKDADIEGMDKDDEDYVCAIRFKRSL